MTTEVTAAGIDCSIKCELYSVYSHRMSEDETLLATWTGPASTVKKVRHNLTVDGDMDHDYIVHRTKSDGGLEWIYAGTSDAWAVPDGAATVNSGFRRELDLAATETMVLRSNTRGASVGFPADADDERIFGIVAERGPTAGVLKAVVGGVTLATIDLKSATATKRTLVGTVTVPAGAVLRLQNATPAGRTAVRVGVDSLVAINHYSAARTGRTTAERPAPRAGGESITYAVPDGQLPATGGVPITLTVKVKGCAGGCEVYREYGSGDPEQLVWSKTSPASSTVQTFTVPTVAPFANWDGIYYTLRKGGSSVSSVEVTPNRFEQDYVSTYDPGVRLTYSAGWAEDSMASATGGAIMRSATPNTGMTYRVAGQFEGRRVSVVAARGPRNGIMKVYNNAVLVKTVDLYAAKWQARQVVATFDTPLKGRLTVVNATPASRPNKDVHVDAVIVFGGYEDWWRVGARS